MVIRQVFLMTSIAPALLVAGAGHAQSSVRDQRLARRIISNLDMTSFRNSITNRQEAGKRTLSDCGFTDIKLTPHGAVASKADGSWSIEFRVILASPSSDAPSFINVCLDDRAAYLRTYSRKEPLAIRPSSAGFWTADTGTNGFPDCPRAYPPIVR